MHGLQRFMSLYSQKHRNEELKITTIIYVMYVFLMEDVSMEEERSSLIEIGGMEYQLILTTKATKEIAKRYGGLENLGDKLMKSESLEMALDEIVWLITLLANQGVLIHNLQNKNDRRELLTEEEVELLTSPFELATYKEVIMEAMYRGTKRYIESEETNTKNTSVG